MLRNREGQGLTINPAHLDFLRMKEKIYPYVPEDNVHLIKKLSEILTFPPFINQEKSLTVFCDFDGVISSPWRSKDEFFSTLRALGKIVRKSSSFTLWSSRININDDDLFWQLPFNIFDRRISLFPFFTDSSLRRLYYFLNQAAGDRQVEINFQIGTEKILGKDGFLELAFWSLQQDSLVTIGSSFFDRRRVKRLVEEAVRRKIPLNNFYYFDTGHLIL